MSVTGDAITFRCEACGFDLSISVGVLADHTRLTCRECGTDYGEWDAIKMRLAQLFIEQDEIGAGEPIEILARHDRPWRIH